MTGLISFISIIMLIACVLIIIAVIIQNPKGGGLDARFGGGANKILGHQRSTDFIEKFTWGLIIFVVACAISLNALYDNDTDNFDDDQVEQSSN